MNTALALLLFAAADVGPKPRDYAGQPTPLKDMKGIEVEMAAEEVRLVLSKAKLEIDATFTLVNHGGDAEFEEGFPVGPFETMTNFSITADGTLLPSKLVDRNAGKPDRAEGTKGQEKAGDYWYVWSAAFKAGATTTHRVRYTVSLEHQRFYHQTGYILHTGAAWKNPIGKAVLILTFGPDCGLSHLRGVTPMTGARFEADRVVWTFEKFEPTKDHDLVIRYALEPWRDELEKVRKEAADSWYGRRVLAARLHDIPSYQGRAKFTSEELKEYLEALGSLVSEGKVDDRKFVLPGTDPERISGPPEIVSAFKGRQRKRYYCLESNLSETFGGLTDEALAAAREYPGDAKAKEVLAAYAAFLKRVLAGEVHLDFRPEGGTISAAKPPSAADRAGLEAKLREAERLLGK